MAKEAGAEGGDRVLDAVAQAVQRAGAGRDCVHPPLLQPARRRRRVLRDIEPRDVQQPIQQDELAEQLTVEDGVQVELYVGRGRQGTGVAQQSQLPAIRDDAPQVGVRAVQQLLDQ